METNTQTTEGTPMHVQTIDSAQVPGWNLWADIWQNDSGWAYTVQAMERQTAPWPMTDGAQAPYLDSLGGIATESEAVELAESALLHIGDGLYRATV